MADNKQTEFRYANASDKKNPAGQGNPVIDGLGTNTVTMYVEGNMGSKVHESRHGGDAARGALTLSNYNVNHEVSAYKAQYSMNGLNYIDANNQLNDQMWQKAIIPPTTGVSNISQITQNMVNSIGSLNTAVIRGVPTRGVGNLYPPIHLTINGLPYKMPLNQWNNK